MDQTGKTSAPDMRVVALVAAIIAVFLVIVLVPQETWVNLSLQLFK